MNKEQREQASQHASEIETKILKYTGKKMTIYVFDPQEPRTRAIITTVLDIESAEQALLRAIREVRTIADKIQDYVEAKPGQKVRALNPNGEMNGCAANDIDRLIAVFLERCKRLSQLVAVL